MEANEFETIPKGGTIQIPERYKTQFSARVRVIVMQEEQPERGEPDIIDRLMENPLKTQNFTPLSREASHQMERKLNKQQFF